MTSNSVIGALRVNLGIDTAEFQDGLKQATSHADKFAVILKTTFAAAAAAAAAALGAIAIGVRSALGEADEMSKMASKIGIPIEELSKLKYVADLAGVSMDGLKASVGKLAKNMVEASKGGGEGLKAFNVLGISATDASGKLKSTSQVMAEIADKFAAMPDGAQKTALAMQLMGRSGADMIPLLNGGSAALNEMMAEAKALGLEISSGTAAAAEQFNDNLSRMGYAISGLTLGVTAALAPALAAASEAMVGFVRWVLGALDYLPVLAEYAAVAGGALAVMLAPAIVAAAGALTVAIGTGLVGAVQLLTAAIMANPLGALAVGITVAITAIYHFRDEIQQAIGIDVVGIAKDAANLVIGSFVAAFEDIKFVWNQFPNIIGAAVIGAVNAVVSGVESMIQIAAGLVDGLIDKVNGALSMIPGVNAQIGKIGELSFLGPVKNPYAEELAKAVGDRNAAVDAAMNTNYLGKIGAAAAAFSGAAPAARDFSTAVAGVNDELQQLGGGGAGASGKTDPWAGLREATDVAKEATGALSQMFSGIGSSIGEAIRGTKEWSDVLSEILNKLTDTAINAFASGLFGSNSGGGGFLSGLLGGLLGFANGGSFKVGGAGGIDSQVVAFRASPDERVDITKPGQQRGDGASYSPVYNIDARGADQAAVARLERGLAERDRAFGKMVDSRMDVRQTRRTRG